MNQKQYKKLGFETLKDFEGFLDREDIRVMIGGNYDHYRELWLARFDSTMNGAEKKKIKGAFNWLALLCFIAWASYRKMHGLFWSMVAMLAALSFAEVYYAFDGTISLTGVWLVFTLMSKDFYLQHLVASAKKLDEMRYDHEKEQFLKWRMGVSKIYAWLALPIATFTNVGAMLLASYPLVVNASYLFS